MSLHHAAWGSPDRVFASLEGRWALDRRFSDGTTMTGTAEFQPLTAGRLGYHEAGRVRLPDGKAFDGSRDYLFEQAEGGFAVYFAETPPRLFHRIGLVAEGDVFSGRASHLCGADTYASRYVFRPDGGFEIQHTVAGPRKDYVSRTVFRRTA